MPLLRNFNAAFRSSQTIDTGARQIWQKKWSRMHIIIKYFINFLLVGKKKAFYAFLNRFSIQAKLEIQLLSQLHTANNIQPQLDRVKRIWYLSPMRAAKVQASLRIRAVSPEPSLLAHTSSESSGTFRQKARSLAPLNGWACAVKVCHDGMLEDTKGFWQIVRYMPNFLKTRIPFLSSEVPFV